MTAVLLIGDMGWGNHMDSWGAGWWIVMAVLMVAFWGLLIFAIAWIVRGLFAGHPDGHGRSALEVLDHRLAGGEISAGEYRRRRATLEGETEGSDETDHEQEAGP